MFMAKKRVGKELEQQQNLKMSSAFLVCWNVEEASMANSVDPDQEQSVLGPHCLFLYLICR